MKIVFFSHLDMNIYLFRLSWMRALREAGHEVLAVVPGGSTSRGLPGRAAPDVVDTFTLQGSIIGAPAARRARDGGRGGLSRSSCRNQFRMVWPVGSNSLARSSGDFPARANSMKPALAGGC